MKKLKSILTSVLALLLAFAVMPVIGTAAETEEKAPLTPGEYTVEVDAHAPGMVVKVTLSEDAIEAVEIVSHEETPGVSDAALETVPGRIVEANSLSIDLVTGATITGEGILAAVAKAIEEAGGNPDDFRLAKDPEDDENDVTRPQMGGLAVPETFDSEYDIVVVGGGFAGLAAAEHAATLGASTVLVEKMPVLGGNSQINGGVYASYTSKIADELYEKLNLEPDTAEKHIEDTIVGGDYMGDPKLIKNLVYGSPVYLDKLIDAGLELRESITRPGGHYGYRTYTTINGIGGDITRVQKEMLDKTDAEVLLNTKMTGIYREQDGDGRVVGIRVTDAEGNEKNIRALKGVILATGGFSGNVEMRSKHVPTLTEDVPTTNHVGATGEAISMAQEIGANTLQMSYIQLYPFANPNNGVLDATAVIPFSGPSAGVVYVDYKGERYVNEGERRDVCSMAAQQSGGFPTFCILGQKIVDEGGFITEEQLQNGIDADRIFKADSLEALAEEINARTYMDNKVEIDPATLAKTIETHNGYVENGEDPDFGKRIDSGVMMTIEEGPFYAIPQWPSAHHTMGGLAITPRAEVQDMWNEIIPGLYAAGEVAGGVHGTNRLGSNATPDALVHGYIAAEVAVTGEVPDFVPAE